jgi:Putative collagen-binding domain of a collagenase
MLSFFRDNELMFWQMANDNARVPAGSDDWVLTSKDGETIIVYRRNDSGIGIKMQGLFGRYSIQWYNPREGGSMQAGTYTTIVAGGNTVVSYGSPPDSPTDDWIILIQSL